MFKPLKIDEYCESAESVIEEYTELTEKQKRKRKPTLIGWLRWIFRSMKINKPTSIFKRFKKWCIRILMEDYDKTDKFLFILDAALFSLISWAVLVFVLLIICLIYEPIVIPLFIFGTIFCVVYPYYLLYEGLFYDNASED